MSDAGCDWLGVGVGLGFDELVAGGGAGAVVGACAVVFAAVGCAFGRPDDEVAGRCVVLVAVGVGWVVGD